MTSALLAAVLAVIPITLAPVSTEWVETLHNDPELQTRIWVERVFEESEWDSAVEVARWESAHTFSPDAYNDAHCAPASVGHAHATGLFQHCDVYWPEREGKARAWLEDEHGIRIDEPLDIWDGWHSTIVAAWLVDVDGWIHFHSCASSARWWRTNRGVGGGGWVKTC